MFIYLCTYVQPDFYYCGDGKENNKPMLFGWRTGHRGGFYRDMHDINFIIFFINPANFNPFQREWYGYRAGVTGYRSWDIVC